MSTEDKLPSIVTASSVTQGTHLSISSRGNIDIYQRGNPLHKGIAVKCKHKTLTALFQNDHENCQDPPRITILSLCGDAGRLTIRIKQSRVGRRAYVNGG